MSIELVLSIAALATSILAFGISTSLTVQRNRSARNSSLAPITVNLFNEYRSQPFKESLHFVVATLPNEHPASGVGFYGLPYEERLHVVRVSQFFDHMGHLVANGFVDERIVASFLGDTVLRVWSVLSEYIDEEEKIRGDEYQVFFRYLASRVSRADPRKTRARQVRSNRVTFRGVGGRRSGAVAASFDFSVRDIPLPIEEPPNATTDSATVADGQAADSGVEEASREPRAWRRLKNAMAKVGGKARGSV